MEIVFVNDQIKNKVTIRLSKNLYSPNTSMLSRELKNKVVLMVKNFLPVAKYDKTYGDVFSSDKLVRIKIVCYPVDLSEKTFKKLNDELVKKFNIVSLTYMSSINSIIIWM